MSDYQLVGIWGGVVLPRKSVVSVVFGSGSVVGCSSDVVPELHPNYTRTTLYLINSHSFPLGVVSVVSVVGFFRFLSKNHFLKFT